MAASSGGRSGVDEDVVTLVVGSRSYEVSKKKLSECSGYFTAMFTSDFAEKNKSVIKLEGVTVTSWEQILFYLSHGRIQECRRENLVEEMLALLQAAAMFQFIDIQERCSRVLFEAVDEASALPVLEVAGRLDCAALEAKARALALWHFDEVTRLEAFCGLEAAQVEGYVGDAAVHSWTGEWGVWEAVDRWLSSSEDVCEARRRHLPRLIKCLHLDSLTLSDLRCMALYESVRSCPLVSAAIDLIIKRRTAGLEGKAVQEHEDDEASSEESVRVQRFIEEWGKTGPRKLPWVPCVVGNVRTGADTVSPFVLRFCEAEGKFVPTLRLNKVESSLGSMVGFKVVADGSRLYMLGGEMMTRQGAWNHAVWMYDQIHKTWTFLSNLLRPTRHLSACCVGDHLYVIGGFGRHRVVQDTVSKLDLKDRVWTVCAPLPRPLYSVPCCVFRNHIYVVQSVVYQYIPSRDVWITLNISPVAKAFANAMANDDFIFLTEAFTGNVYKLNPSDPSLRLEILGTFKNECVQACLIGDHIYSLSQDEFGEDICCEKLDIRTGGSAVLWEGPPHGGVADLGPKHRHGCFPLLLY